MKSGSLAGAGGVAASAAWTDEDEVRLLKTALEFVMEPAERFDPSYSPCDRLRRPLRGIYSRTDVVEKVKELRSRYEADRRRIGRGRGVAYEISGKIWGGRGGRGSPVRYYTRKRKREAAAAAAEGRISGETASPIAIRI